MFNDTFNVARTMALTLKHALIHTQSRSRIGRSAMRKSRLAHLDDPIVKDLCLALLHVAQGQLKRPEIARAQCWAPFWLNWATVRPNPEILVNQTGVLL
jgi:hypothetical protein